MRSQRKKRVSKAEAIVTGLMAENWQMTSLHNIQEAQWNPHGISKKKSTSSNILVRLQKTTTKRRLWIQPEQTDFLQRNNCQANWLLNSNKRPKDNGVTCVSGFYKILVKLELITQWKAPSRIKTKWRYLQKRKKRGFTICGHVRKESKF